MYTEEKKVVKEAIEMIANDPIVIGQNKGKEYGDWVYDLPKRIRTVREWTQDVYIDGSLGEKVYGEPVMEEEEARISVYLSPWNYDTVESTLERTRNRVVSYLFSDATFVEPSQEVDVATGRYGRDYYSYLEQNKKFIDKYNFSNGDVYSIVKRVEAGEVKIDYSVEFSAYTLDAGGKGLLTTSLITPIQAAILWNGEEVMRKEVTNPGIIPISGMTGFSIDGTIVRAEDRTTVAGDSREFIVAVWGTIDLEDEIVNNIVSANRVTITQAANRETMFGSLSASPGTLSFVKAGGSQQITIDGSSLGLSYTTGALKSFNFNDGRMDVAITSEHSNWLTYRQNSITSYTIEAPVNNYWQAKRGEIHFLYYYGSHGKNVVVNVTQAI